MKLYIIGNGFDRHYDLNTSTDDFKSFLSKEKVYNAFGDASEVFLEYGVCWSEFEKDIASIDLDLIEENQLQGPDYLSDHESDRDGCILNMEMHLDSLREAVFSALRKMAVAANETKLSQDYCFDSDYIINFNYTNTVEKVSINPISRPVFHIHGAVEQGSQLIFGYKSFNTDYDVDKYSNPETGDYYLETQVKLIDEFYRSFKKSLSIKELNTYLNEISESIDSVFVLGHSIGEVDLQYFEIINQTIKPVEWNVSYYKDDDLVLENIKKLSFYNIVNLFKW